MTQVTFVVSSSSFVANMCVKRNTDDFGHKYLSAGKIIEGSFHIDDYLTGVDLVEESIEVVAAGLNKTLYKCILSYILFSLVICLFTLLGLFLSTLFSDL